MKKMLLVLLLVAVSDAGIAQLKRILPQQTFNRDGRFSFGMRGGSNLWINDFERRQVSGGGDVFVRYSFTNVFSLGMMGGYDVLQARQRSLDLTGNTPLQYDYVEAKGFSADLVAWFHFISGSFVTPYAYIGGGVYRYKRKVSGDIFYPDDKNYTTYHIPAGFGLDAMFSKYVGFTLDLGVRIMDDLTDALKRDVADKTVIALDWYPTAKAGLMFFFGSSNYDDDDADGLTLAEERKFGTDPDNPDTDGDGLLDGEELKLYTTDPRKADSDGDGIRDGDEILIYKTNPNKADTDGDGLSDGDEIFRYNTDPFKADTDGDGLTDGEEVLKYKTNPLKADTDGDGLTDADEIARGTNPLNPDTDGGGVEDGLEVARGTNPLDRHDDIPKPPPPLEVGKAIILEGITFRTGKSAIEPESEPTLMRAFATMKDNPEISVEIRGYTDNTGSESLNYTLSQRRAEAVRSWLIFKGIESWRITARGFGPSFPIGDNRTAEGRSQNRRIEFFRTK
ncbi:OmpA family protein [Sphingobacteriales bacterium CHB3]|nr:OmpA family protein [Sphingobacteriales bacterium CHB3]